MRIDQVKVARGFARSRAVAAELLRDGRVTVRGKVVGKPSLHVDPDEPVVVEGDVDPWVGRAAYKLLAALDAFPIAVDGRRCIDVGASTGGFTQVLLSRGARSVVALDVGHGQLAASVAADARVQERSGSNVRGIDPVTLGGPADLVVADLSFISLRLVLADLAALTAEDGDVVALIKPQFEIGRERLGRAGVVVSTQQRAEVVRSIVDSSVQQGLWLHGLLTSPVVGGTGNTEYLMWASRRSTGKMTGMAIQEFVDQVRQGVR